MLFAGNRKSAYSKRSLCGIPGRTANDLLAIFLSAHTDFDLNSSNSLSLDVRHKNHLSAASISIGRQICRPSRRPEYNKILENTEFHDETQCFIRDKLYQTADLLNAMASLVYTNEYNPSISSK